MTETDIAALVAEIKSMAEGGMCAQEADILALIADWERRGKELDALREEVEDMRASLDRMSCAEFALSARIAELEGALDWIAFAPKGGTGPTLTEAIKGARAVLSRKEG